MKFSKNTIDNSTRGERIRRLRELKGLSQQQLADLVHMAQGVLHKLEKDEQKKSGFMVSIATALGTTAEYLETGKGFVNETPSSGKIPILSWHEIKKWVFHNEKNPLTKDETREFIFPPKENIGSRSSYALKITGNSMQSNSHESLNIGDYIIVDPDKKEKSGDFIIYNSPGDKSPLVRKLIIENKNYLVALNKSYPLETIDDTAQSCGVVVSKISMF